MAPAPPLMTTDEYLRTPETVLPQELIYGALRVAEAPAPRHQSAVADLFRALDTHVRIEGLGNVWLSPIDVILDARRALIVQPDLLFISKERSWIVKDRIRGAPDLVIEVLSPRPRIGRLDERVAWFAEYGVDECWLLHQDDQALEVLRLGRAGVVARQRFDGRAPIRSAVLPRFQATLEEILGDATTY
jgi:Uma2 family endonuclease